MATDKIEPVDLQLEMQRSYLDYAMSVIVGRALPDVRDGLKPVHRRVVYAMFDGGYRPDRAFSKCARVVGEVMGQYHPHGDSAIYDALVRLVQPWSLRYPLALGQGNFGSPGNDGAAASRYTETKMAPLALEMVRDIDEDTVDFQDNYDGRTQEPEVLPARFPESPRQRLRRHRGRHGDEHPAAQPPRGGRRRALAARAPRRRPRRAARGAPAAGSRARTSRPARRSSASRASRTRIAPAAARSRCAPSSPSRRSRAAPASSSPSCRTRSIPTTSRSRSPSWSRISGSPASPTSATRAPAAPASASSSCSSATRSPKVVLNNLYKHTQLQENFGANMLAIVDGVPRTLADRRLHQPVGRPPGRGHRAPHRVPSAQGRGRRAHPARLPQGPRHARRGARAHPPVARGGRRAGRPDGAARGRRGAGQRDPQPAAAPPRRARAAEDHRPGRRARAPDRRLQGHPGQARPAAARSSRTSCARSSTSSATTAAPRSCSASTAT